MKKIFALIFCLLFSVSIFAKQHVVCETFDTDYSLYTHTIRPDGDAVAACWKKMYELIQKGYKIIQFAVTIDGYVILYEDPE